MQIWYRQQGCFRDSKQDFTYSTVQTNLDSLDALLLLLVHDLVTHSDLGDSHCLLLRRSCVDAFLHHGFVL